MSNKASTVELKLNFPKEELEFLTLCAEKKGVSLRQMAVYFIIKGIHGYEDYLEDKKFDGTREDEKEKTTWKKNVRRAWMGNF